MYQYHCDRNEAHRQDEKTFGGDLAARALWRRAAGQSRGEWGALKARPAELMAAAQAHFEN